MITLPRWVREGLTWALAVFSEAFAVVTLPASTRPDLDLLALALFIAGTVALWAASRVQRGQRAIDVAATLVCIAVALLVPAGLDPVEASYSNGAWHVTAITCIAVVLLMRGRNVLAGIAMTALVLQTVLWSGFAGLIAFGVAAVALLLLVAIVSASAVRRTEQDMARYGAAEREAVGWRAAQEAFHLERQMRLLRTGRTASSMLQRIVEREGDLSEEDRQECRVLEQTLRDEIRGRDLMSDPLREAVLAARRRGAFVQVLDDGGLERADRDALDAVLDEVAAAVRGVTSDRIVIRTADRSAGTVVTVAAVSADPVAAALGLDDEEEIDLWLELPVPVALPARG